MEIIKYNFKHKNTCPQSFEDVSLLCNLFCNSVILEYTPEYFPYLQFVLLQSTVLLTSPARKYGKCSGFNIMFIWKEPVK
jgi:hypothetical protein